MLLLMVVGVVIVGAGCTGATTAISVIDVAGPATAGSGDGEVGVGGGRGA